VDISGKIAQIRKMVDAGKYFTINRGRQYGKTTTLSALRRNLADAYIVIPLSFEGIGDSAFESEAQFVASFMKLVQRALRFSSAADDDAYLQSWVNPAVTNFEELSEHITNMCQNRRLVLTIDEVDASSNYRVYIRFLGMLRDKFLKQQDDMDFTFQSVILAGVYDIKNIKTKMKMNGVYTSSPEEGGIYNSPWNIATDFEVDMSFSAAEIGTMLASYEEDHHTGMDIPALSEMIREWTSGYPFLVSRICQVIDEKLDKNWTLAGVELAIKYILQEKSTLFDDMIKNMEMYSNLYRYIYELLVIGEKKKDAIDNPIANLGMMFSFLKQVNGYICIANRIFENRLLNYFRSKDDEKQDTKRVTGVFKTDVVAGGRINMELALRKFAKYFREIFNERDTSFLERNGRMVFLSYLMPLINGDGFYHLESQFTDLRRMDIVVDYGRQQFIIELKLWHGEEAEQKAWQQLAGYLQSKQAAEGYLVIFDLRKERKAREEWIEAEGRRIFEVVL
jgi:hypothetical protein